MAAEPQPAATPSPAHQDGTSSDAGANGEVAVNGSHSGEIQVDEELLPFDLVLHFPERPLVPATATSLGLPATPSPLKLAVQPSETLNDIRITLADSPEGYWLGSYCFKRPAAKAGQANGAVAKSERVGEWVELKDIFDGVPKGERELSIAYAPLNEAEARNHIQRLRDLLQGGPQDPINAAIDAGLSVHDAVRHPEEWTKEAVGFAAAQAAANNKAKGSKKAPVDLAEEAAKVPFEKWNGWPDSNATQLIPPQARSARFSPTCLRSISLSAWNPPPQPLRARGHLLYLQITTLEGETVHLTASVNGFYINKSTSSRFDPAPRPKSEAYLSNSLFDLLCGFSPLFLNNFAKIFSDPLSARDFFAVLPMTNCIAAAPWLANNHSHTADPLRPQTAYLLTGTMGVDSLEGTRDWNEEIQAARELPRSTLAERHVRERALGRLFSDFAKSAASAVPKVAAGEVQALNPMDKPEAQMFCVNNLFISRGVDGVDIYPYLGGDEAAHVAVSKDVQGVRMLNTVDADGLCLLGTVIVDWHGERWVAQSIIPGLFRKKEEDEVVPKEGEEVKEAEAAAEKPKAAALPSDKPSPAEDTQVIYGGVEGPEVIRTNAAFDKVFEQVAKSLRLSRHAVKDAQGKDHQLWLSVDSKGLRGADGRKYALDVARLTPVDVMWLEEDMEGKLLGEGDAKGDRYPHELALLRPELIEIYWDSEFRKWAREQLAQRKKASEEGIEKKSAIENGDAKGEESADKKEDAEAAEEPLDSSAFQLSFNPDAFVKFKPPTDETAAPTPMITDESDASVAAVRAASRYLRESAIPRLVTDIATGMANVSDGQALTRQMHARGINVRYLGHLAHLAAPAQHDRLDQTHLKQCTGSGWTALLSVLHKVAVQEMVVRAAKKILNNLLRTASPVDLTACVSHFLNCLLGAARESAPHAEWTPSPFDESPEEPAWAKLTPASLQEKVDFEVRRRYRFQLPSDYLTSGSARKPQLLREVSIRSGIQLKLQEYAFDAIAAGQANGHHSTDSDSARPATPPATSNKAATSVSVGNKKKKGGKKVAGIDEVSAAARTQSTTFSPEDVLNLLPIVKDSAPTSKVAEDAFETGRITMMSRGERELGVDLLLEGISFHETIYGMAHPETARCYALFAAIVHQLSTLINAETAAKIREEQEKQGKEDVQVEMSAYAEHLSGATALRYQRQAVTISERALGLDHAETLAQWSSLAILERAEGNHEASLRCERRVMQLQDIVLGAKHPDNVSALSNLATTLQAARRFDDSLQVFTSAHNLALELFGPDALVTANVAFELCQAQSLVGELRAALETLKESVRVFEAVLGKDHAHTKEADVFLGRLAAAAVRAAKMEQSQKIREAQIAAAGGAKRLGAGGALAAAAAAAAQAGAKGQTSTAASASASSSKKSGRTAVDPSLSVDELVRYISGSGGAGAGGNRKGKGKAAVVGK
ncbi:hypothetical protein BDZ90DRAFT_160733 [Jaminaea rosea]|uniref:Clustered mitochondria protein homolog n=1 Tax=Jaminaea rosea TaxID=1569628 RepID=A0A316URZ2_9BASI|nr:hypothetical protein BDZ90DRAFT_160733 [Jaminaea rosea]PWN28056.1 hypothetical protein BDZ90DRAFT_160733 [Jaminaea rosea]